jgi:large subunit ribosomal protein L23
MAILNIFSKKQAKKVSKEPKQEKKDSPKASDVQKETSAPVVSKGYSKEHKILIKPHFSEKFTLLGQEENKYVFEVKERATKNEVKKSIESIYKVKVLKINTLKAPQKTKRWRTQKSIQKGNKKMIVTLKEGQKIELGI